MDARKMICFDSGIPLHCSTYHDAIRVELVQFEKAMFESPAIRMFRMEQQLVGGWAIVEQLKVLIWTAPQSTVYY